MTPLLGITSRPIGSSTLRVDLGVKNITDEKYYTASDGIYRISVGAPRTVFAGLRLDLIELVKGHGFYHTLNY